MSQPPLPQFHRFMDLPTELRLSVFEWAIHPYVLGANVDGETVRLAPVGRSPLPLRDVSYEAREVFDKCHTAISFKESESCSPITVWANETTVLFVGSSDDTILVLDRFHAVAAQVFTRLAMGMTHWVNALERVRSVVREKRLEKLEDVMIDDHTIWDETNYLRVPFHPTKAANCYLYTATFHDGDGIDECPDIVNHDGPSLWLSFRTSRNGPGPRVHCVRSRNASPEENLSVCWPYYNKNCWYLIGE